MKEEDHFNPTELGWNCVAMLVKFSEYFTSSSSFNMLLMVFSLSLKAFQLFFSVPQGCKRSRSVLWKFPIQLSSHLSNNFSKQQIHSRLAQVSVRGLSKISLPPGHECFLNTVELRWFSFCLLETLSLAWQPPAWLPNSINSSGD